MSHIAVVTFNDIPVNERTCKYSVLGELSRLRFRLYCERHGYDLIDQVEIDRSRPVCWAKIPAIREALREHEWVLWADSDTLVADMSYRLESLCDAHYDLIVQYQEFWWDLIGLKGGTELCPMNSGAFLLRSSPWSEQFLSEAYAQTQYVSRGEIWDGIGDQEAMNHCLRTHPGYRERIKYAKTLQIAPKLFEPGYLLVHFYGNHAQTHIASQDCAAVLSRWSEAVSSGWPLPDDMMRFHWCCIQNRNAFDPHVKGDLGRYLYTRDDIGE